MATGTLKNMAMMGFVRTPPRCAERIVQHLLAFGTCAHILDPTVGEGDLLAPCLAHPGRRLYGVELSDDRAARARDHLPGATILTHDTEAVAWAAGSFDLVLANPPYMMVDGQRAEYRIVKRSGEALRPGGVMVAILPARSGWEAHMIHHFARCYDQIRCWKFADADDTTPTTDGNFQHYTQIVVVGVRRASPLDLPPTEVVRQLNGWRWCTPKGAESPWAQGFAPPDLPDAPLSDRYLILDALATPPSWRVTKASDSMLLEALHTSGAHLAADYVAATTWQADVEAERSIMPATGQAHLAADILTGLLDGEPITGPDGSEHVFSSYITSEWAEIPVEAEVLEEQAQKGVIRMKMRQQQDKMVLGDFNLATGEIVYHQGDAVYEFLAPWLARLATLALARRKPLYELRPDAWELRAVASFGWDKRLPKALHPGLAPAQQHRVYAMGRAIDVQKKIAIQAEPGTGKTRQTLAVAKRQSVIWHHPALVQGEVGGALPRWGKRLRRAWRSNPRAAALLPRGATIPAALPVLVATPKRVIPTWVNELAGAWPEAESVVIRSYRDIEIWLRRCATSKAPMVLGIVSHSLSRAFDRQWVPAILERRWVKAVTLDQTRSCWVRVSEDASLQEILRAQVDAQAIVIEGQSKPESQVAIPAEAPTNGDVVTSDAMAHTDSAAQIWRQTRTIVEYRCPTCGAVQEAVPRSGHDLRRKTPATEKGTSEDLLERVTSLTWFASKPRECCACHAPLWVERRVNAKAQGIAFADWAAAVEAEAGQGQKRALTRGGRQVGKPTWLVQADGTRGLYPAASFSPFAYLRRFYPGCVALAIIDESHNARGRATDIAQSIHSATLASQTAIYASGTHYGGTLDDLFHYWFRFCPQFWLKLGFSWEDVERAIATFGVIQQTTKEYEGDARRGSGKTDVRVTTLPAPGISAKLIPHLLKHLVFLTVLDVGSYMPPLREFPVIVSMADPELRAQLEAATSAEYAAREAHDQARRRVWDLQATSGGEPSVLQEVQGREQEAKAEAERLAQALAETKAYVDQRDLASHYHALVLHLEDLASQMNSAAMLAKGTTPRWFAALPCVDPHFEVVSRYRDDWGNVVDQRVIASTPVLEANYLYPLERALLRTVAQETQEPLDPEQPERKRTCMIYYEQNAIRDMGSRLAWVLREFDPWILPNSVEPEDREEAIRQAIALGHQVVVVPYRRVAEGINLQDCVDTICWMELAQNLFHLDQASRRAWRLGRAHEVRLYYFAYLGSAAHRKLQKLGSQSGAAAAFAGEPARGALAEHVGADKTTLARLSQSIEDLDEAPAHDDIADLQAQFDRRGRELEAALAKGRQWMGIEDPLPSMLEVLYPELEAAAAANHPPITAVPKNVPPEVPAPAPSIWGEAQPIPAPLPVVARVRWDDPDLFRRAHPRLAARREKARALARGEPVVTTPTKRAATKPKGQPTVVSDIPNQKVVPEPKAEPFPLGSLWAGLDATLSTASVETPEAPVEIPVQLTLFG